MALGVFYTIGQRHGLYISGNVGELNTGLPYYVVKKDLDRNIVYVSRNLNDKNVWAKQLELKDVILRNEEINNLTVRLRHLGELIPATLEGDTLHFQQSIKKPAAGQSAVFYDREICLGGGIIA